MEKTHSVDRNFSSKNPETFLLEGLSGQRTQLEVICRTTGQCNRLRVVVLSTETEAVLGCWCWDDDGGGGGGDDDDDDDDVIV